ncbi:UDP-glucose 6-dehydrogenase YwqF [Oxobacter pfennigii]|uniref:UDP-glucose 6-dehydrogenase n=1 Tax=Oxobacter pfennigii TaxID=36849 RepID=A0A0P8WDY0_9CLOT|nr:UDP-glucose/GDP-mannose dehydrogenase family protein [Oxobacter pfennigii]KPU46293.1 UDP-glucose 6-dehydrogenase YwqF [Oxobacter pfennigii]
MKAAIIGGSGYVGLVTGAGLSQMGHTVVCMDVDKRKIENLQKGIPPIYEDGLKELIDKNMEEKSLIFTCDLKKAMDKADVVFITVGTPENEDGSADLSYIYKAAESIAKHINEYMVVVLKSTVPVGTCDKVYDIIQANTADKKIYFDVVSNPEFLREGSAVKDFFNPDRIVIGTESIMASGVLKELYRNFKCPLLVTGRRSSELIKYASNTFLALRLSFINEIAEVCENAGGDIEEVAKGMGLDKRIGQSYLKAGIGFGGPCLVKDLKALINTAEKYDCGNELLKAALNRNYMQSRSFIKKLKSMLGTLENKQIIIAGLSFKPGTDDTRNSPSLNMISSLLEENAQVYAYDPKVKFLPKPYSNSVTFVEDIEGGAKGKDAIIFMTEWEEFNNINFKKVGHIMRTPVIADGRNIFNPYEMIKNGFKYTSIGRKQTAEIYAEENAV